MRLWHYSLIRVLPRQQLLGQWRECCLIAKNISEKGTPNHILVNPIMDHPIEAFIYYSICVSAEMEDRGYAVNPDRFTKYFTDEQIGKAGFYILNNPFPKWHTERYLTQCLANLEEKYDRGGISKEEWNKILKFISSRRKMKNENCKR